jgi:hypothetical protein
MIAVERTGVGRIGRARGIGEVPGGGKDVAA